MQCLVATNDKVSVLDSLQPGSVFTEAVSVREQMGQMTYREEKVIVLDFASV